MSVKVGETTLQALKVRLLDFVGGHASVHLEAIAGADYHSEFGAEAGFATLDVEELLGSQVGTKSCFCDAIVSERHAEFGAKNRVATMRDIAERSSMHDGRRVLGGLHEVGEKGIVKQHADGSSTTQILDCEWSVVVTIAEQDILYPATQVFATGGQAKDGHDFTSRCDVEPAFGRNAVALSSETKNDLAQTAVVDVKHTLPEYLLQGWQFLATMIEIVVEKGCDGVVGRGHGMEVAREVEVDLLHRQHLCIAATCCTAFHAKAWT